MFTLINLRVRLTWFYFYCVPRLNKVELSPEETPYISFRADHLGLREAILSYGRVDANGLPLATAFEDPSKPSASLPRHLEEYEDWDHHVFYKTVGQAQAGVNPSTSVSRITAVLSSNLVADKRLINILCKYSINMGCHHAPRSATCHTIRSCNIKITYAPQN